MSKNDLEGAKVAEQLLDTYKQLKNIEKEKFNKLSNSEAKIEKKENNVINRTFK